MTNNIIKEGGVAGHMNHLYENPYLTFKEMKDIIQKASEGKLEGTEKTDGQNLFISYSARSGKAVAARNKGNIKSGGLDAAGLAKKFKDRGALENAFNDAFSAFEQAASKLSPEAQLKLFGEDAEIYYNSEVQDPESPNVIHYDEPNLVIHKVGHVRVVGAEGEKELKPFNIKGVDHFFNELIRHGDRDAEAQRFRLQKNAVRKLEAISDDTVLSATLEKLERELNKVGISDNQTVMEYVVARIKPLLQNIELPEEQYEMFIRRILSPMTDEKGLTKVMITKGVSPEMKQQVNKFVSTNKSTEASLIKKAVTPLENIIHDFAVELLRGLESAFILDNKKEVERLQGKVSNAINAIEASGDEDKIAVLRQQMEKLKDAENVSAAAEGFVFDYNGVTYKFTGNFAPANQVLGLFKFGRKGSIPMEDLFIEPGAPQGEAEFWYGKKSPVPPPYPLQEVIDPDKAQHVVMIAGGFKPPHRGHLKMVKDAIETANPRPDRVVLFTGEEKRDEIGIEESLQMWQVYLRNEGLSGYIDIYAFKPMPVPGKFKKSGEAIISSSPMVPMYIESVALPQDSKITFVSSQADPGHGTALTKSIEKERPDLEVDSIAAEVDPDPKTGKKYSATYMRLAIQKNDFERFEEFVPDSSKGQAHYIWTQILGKGKPIESGTEESGLIDEMINEVFINEFSSMAGGKCAGHMGETENEGLIREEGDEEMHFEDKLRRVIKDKIKIKMKKYGKQVIEEEKFRKIVRSLLKEAAMEDTPSRSTGINKLVGALKIILPVIERAYKGLTTSPEQRDSFKKHLTKAIIDTLSPEAALRGADLGPDATVGTEDDLPAIQEVAKVSVDPTMADIDADPKGINIDVADSEPTKGADEMAAEEDLAAAEEEESAATEKVAAEEGFEDIGGQEREFPTLAGLDETGRDEAVDIYKRVIDAVVRTYRRLHDERDRSTYQDYLVTNLLLYFDKWESDISGEIGDISTPEYEKQTQEKEKFAGGAEEALPEEEPLAEQILVRLREMDII